MEIMLEPYSGALKGYWSSILYWLSSTLPSTGACISTLSARAVPHSKNSLRFCIRLPNPYMPNCVNASNPYREFDISPYVLILALMLVLHILEKTRHVLTPVSGS